jgi:DNA-binding NarL/FixJ family response regulator
MSAAERPIRVLVVDDQTLLVAGLVRLLREDSRLEVVGTGSTGVDAIEQVEKLTPDVVLMDLKMPEMDGIEATKQITRDHPGVRVLVLSSFEAETQVVEALKVGASGYVLKDAEPEAIISSIIAVHAGEQVMASAVARKVVDMLSGHTAPKQFYDGLTPREIEILKLVAAGMPNKRIAYNLHISEKTVRNHIVNMYSKLHIFDRTQAVLYAVRRGLVEA